jgi:hypothetical protein
MPYWVYSTGFDKNANTIIPFVVVEDQGKALAYVQEFLEEHRAVGLFNHEPNIWDLEIIDRKGIRFIEEFKHH